MSPASIKGIAENPPNAAHRLDGHGHDQHLEQKSEATVWPRAWHFGLVLEAVDGQPLCLSDLRWKQINGVSPVLPAHRCDPWRAPQRFSRGLHDRPSLRRHAWSEL